MKTRGHIAFASVVVVVFVVLVGALGYTYLVNMNAEIASNDKDTESLVAPEIAQTSDLDKALEVLDDADLDADLKELDDLENQL